MAKPILTAERLRALTHYDPDTGIITWRISRHSCAAGARAGCVNSSGYEQIMVEGTVKPSHHLAWLYVYGEWPKYQIDHINGDRRDNRIANLRDVPSKVNAQNKRKAQRGSASGVLGAHYHKGKNHYQATVVVDGKGVHVGVFKCKYEAHEAYLKAKRMLHEGCTI